MEDLSKSISNMRKKYREIFLTTVDAIKQRVDEIKPKTLDGDIFDTFEKDHLQPSCRIFDHHSHPPDQVEFDVMSGACCRPGTATGNILVLTVDIVGCDNPSGPVQFPCYHSGLYLDIGHVRPYLPYGDNAASVDISERV